jgi:hypothetical protein
MARLAVQVAVQMSMLVLAVRRDQEQRIKVTLVAHLYKQVALRVQVAVAELVQSE